MPVSPAALGRASLTPSEASRAHAEARENAVACRDASRPDDVPRSAPQAVATEKQARASVRQVAPARRYYFLDDI